MEIIQNAANEMLVNLALAVIALLSAYLMYFIHRAMAKMQMQAAQIKDEEGRKLLEAALSDVEHLATITVGAIEQTVAGTLREAVKEGKAEHAELSQLGRQAFNKVKASIQPEMQRVITTNLGSFDDYLEKVIENTVRKVKQEDPYLTLPDELLSTDA